MRNAKHETAKKKSPYKVLTDRLIEKLEAGTVPWRAGWAAGGAPRNLISGKPYRGINVFVLGLAGYNSPYWLTFNQAKKRGGSIRKGEHGTPVSFWKLVESSKLNEETGKREPVTVPLLRYYIVFNLEQTRGIDDPGLPQDATPPDPIEAAQEIVDNMPRRPAIRPGKPCYIPSTDTVRLPALERFRSAAEYYGTAFHELAHSTGHPSRLGRPGITRRNRFGSEDYSKEELIAEMTSAFLCNSAGIVPATLDNSAAYIRSWLRALRDDRRVLVHAAGAAQKAADFILKKTS